MVEVHVLGIVATVKYSTCVAVPLRGVNVDRKWTHFSNVSKHSILVVGGQGVVPGESYSWCSCLNVEGAVPRLSGRARCVGPALLQGVPKQLQVTEPQLGNGASAATNAATVERVRGARGHLLRRKLQKRTCGNGCIGLDHLSGGKSPTASALTLVLHRAHNSFLPPVNRGGQVPFWDGTCGTRRSLGQGSGVGSLHTTQVEASELLLVEIRKLSHPCAVA